eukprot:TRINITY_DN430_c0_g1_i4.p1 TRINITY_DN430_c0_g1~~TRINITY_DN430_c0_g1_i4.p1  ORF type:complete len:150 (+),score=13.68 TRINITY_DN430_c0_g1_i4:89-538(+)
MSGQLVKDYLVIQDFFGRYVTEAGGKDKMLRLGCYLCRLSIGLIDKGVVSATLAADLKPRISGLEKSMGHCRRVCRVGKMFILFHNILVVAPKKYQNDFLLKYLDILKNLILICYNYNDHLYWIGSIGLVKSVDGPKRSWNAGLCWFLR